MPTGDVGRAGREGLRRSLSNDRDVSRRARCAVLAAVVVLSFGATVTPAGGAGSEWLPTGAETVAGTWASVNPGKPSCVSPSFCFLPAFVEDSRQRVRGFLEHWTSHGWQMIGDAQPFGAIPYGSTCRSTSYCWVVGAVVGQAGNEVTFTEQWNGRIWTRRPSPNIASGGSAQNAISAVTCLTASNCLATGGANDGVPNGLGQYFVLHWDGFRWTVVAHGTPPGMTGLGLGAGLSCPTASSCFAAGSARSADSAYHPFVVSYDGSSWTPTALPMPDGAASAFLTSIDCPSPGSCLAVGAWEPSTSSQLSPLVERWDGQSWSVLSLPPDVQQSATEYDDISCLNATACWTVGWLSDVSTGNRTPAASSWDGQSMTVGNVRVGSTAREFLSVVCLVGLGCRALGDGRAQGTALLTGAEISAS